METGSKPRKADPGKAGGELRPPREDGQGSGFGDIANGKKRPIPVLAIGCLYIATGALGLVFHWRDFERQPFFSESLWIIPIESIAAVAGAALLRGHNWARWLAIVWIAFHVVLSAFHPWPELAAHSAFFAAIAFFLFRPNARRYFRGAVPKAPGP